MECNATRAGDCISGCHCVWCATGCALHNDSDVNSIGTFSSSTSFYSDNIEKCWKKDGYCTDWDSMCIGNDVRFDCCSFDTCAREWIRIYSYFLITLSSFLMVLSLFHFFSHPSIRRWLQRGRDMRERDNWS